jgi:hypothetical protein
MAGGGLEGRGDQGKHLVHATLGVGSIAPAVSAAMPSLIDASGSSIRPLPSIHHWSSDLSDSGTLRIDVMAWLRVDFGG